jgi:outer membrane protein
MIRKFVRSFIVLGTILSINSFAAENLSLDGFVQMALLHNPTIRVSQASVKSSAASKSQALAVMLPHLDANAGASRSGSFSPSSGISDYSTGLALRQLVFDFGKSQASRDASGKLYDAANLDDIRVKQEVMVDACSAYFSFLLAQSLLQVAQDALTVAQKHLDQTKMLVEVGKQAHYTVTKAEVDVANAEVAVIKNEHSLKLAKLQMDIAVGVPLPDSFVLTDSLQVMEPEIQIEDAMKQALEKRQDLRSAAAQCEAARLSLVATKRSLLPDINANAGYGFGKIDNADWHDNYSVGISLNASLYEGGALVASCNAAQAAYDRSKASYDILDQSIQNEVKQLYYEKTDALQRIGANRKLISASEEGLVLSQEKFKTGGASPLDVTDAEQTLANAKSSYVQALCDYRIAHVKLVAAIGGM